MARSRSGERLDNYLTNHLTPQSAPDSRNSAIFLHRVSSGLSITVILQTAQNPTRRQPNVTTGGKRRDRDSGRVLKQRNTLLEDIAHRLKTMRPHDVAPLQSVRAAQRRCAQLTPAEFVSFTENWLTSLAVWRSLLPHPFHADSVGKALAELGLSHAVLMHQADPSDASGTVSPKTEGAEVARQFRVPGPALIHEVLGGRARSILSGQGRKFLDRFPQTRSSEGRGRGPGPRVIERGGGASGPPQRSLTNRHHAEDEDRTAADGRQQLALMVSLHELGPQWAAVQVPGLERAGDDYVE